MESLESTVEKANQKTNRNSKGPDSSKLPPAGLSDLPFEIRLRIYHYLIPQNRVIEVNNPRIEYPFHDIDLNCDVLTFGRNRNSYLLVSKQISEETLDILYGENIFKIYLHVDRHILLWENFTTANIRRMRDILVIAHPGCVSRQVTAKPNEELWASVLPNLRRFRLVAEQPQRGRSYYGAPMLEQQLEEWDEWLRPFLECFGRYLSEGTVVEVDTNEKVETEKIVQESLPNGWRRVPCPIVGDIIFMRGDFSLELEDSDDDMGLMSASLFD
jgi:hypothetical protein